MSLRACVAVEQLLTAALCSQRGEGLNRHLKPLLDGRSGLTKLYQEVSFRVKHETARTFMQDLKQTIHYFDVGCYAKQILPAIYEEACDTLTTYGLARFIKQIQASSLYNVRQVVVGQQQHGTEGLLHAPTHEDPELNDLPSSAALPTLMARFNVDTSGATVFEVTISPLVSKRGALSAQHVVLWDRLPGEGGVNKRHFCTCGFCVRAGVPCRHFWAVAINSREASFNFGLVNDLWFREAQKLNDTAEVFNIDGEVSGICCAGLFVVQCCSCSCPLQSITPCECSVQTVCVYVSVCGPHSSAAPPL